MTGKVILFHPPYDGPPLGPPLSLLSLASPLVHAGMSVSIVDGSIEPDFKSVLAREIRDAVCLGISLLTGRMILCAIDVAQCVRQLRPEVPIIFGGWHPSLLPEQTLKEDRVDIVARGQGERTLFETVIQLQEKKSLESVQGISFKAKGRSIHNPDRPVENINNFPPPAFELGNFDAYRLTDVALLDSNFPVNVKRAVEIASGFIQSGIKFRWTFQASTDLLCRMTDDEVRMLAESGVAHMGFGTESASEEVLQLMNKKHQRIDEMFETARKASVAGIRVTFNLILGYPGETERDRLDTFRTMTQISRMYSNVRFSPNIFTPYPGIPIWPQLREMGVKEPQSLEEWADVSLGSNHLPWLQGEDLRRLSEMLQYFMLDTRRSLLTGQELNRGLQEVC